MLVILVWGIVACWSYLFGVLRPTGTLWQALQGEVQVTSPSCRQELAAAPIIFLLHDWRSLHAAGVFGCALMVLMSGGCGGLVA